MGWAAGPLRWIGAIIVLVVLVFVVTPLALEALSTSVTFGQDDQDDGTDAGPTATPTPEGTPTGGRGPSPTAPGRQTPGPTGTGGPQPTATPVQTGPAEPETYVVEPGDTLYQVAEQFYGDGGLYPRIQEANDLETTALQVGQELVIPPLE